MGHLLGEGPGFALFSSSCASSALAPPGTSFRWAHCASPAHRAARAASSICSGAACHPVAAPELQQLLTPGLPTPGCPCSASGSRRLRRPPALPLLLLPAAPRKARAFLLLPAAALPPRPRPCPAALLVPGDRGAHALLLLHLHAPPLRVAGLVARRRGAAQGGGGRAGGRLELGRTLGGRAGRGLLVECGGVVGHRSQERLSWAF